MRHLLVTTVVVGSAVACSHADDSANAPMTALASSTPTTTYVHEFWLDQARRHTPLWDSAYVYCAPQWSGGSKPNCGHVKTAHFFHAGATAPIRRSAGNASRDFQP